MMVSRGQKIRSHISFSQYQNSHTETSRILFRPRVIIHSGTAVPWPSLYRTTGGRLRLPVTLRSLASTTDNMLSENSDRVICSRPSVESEIHKPWNRNPDSKVCHRTRQASSLSQEFGSCVKIRDQQRATEIGHHIFR
ncbi:uncharacterized protein CLUP02_05047 [Colletotrichum lupini]|uniref:Uncharacterized protein n=1 Tax=Colletotrichum lupini TaxID=145971 RepID=A0A9Q8WE98_9PEZI|nr:uncharacterized protein CLUP02_05047 [Colletotrichum lupini]UQC79567.1 hypothetical protein CLUP02_05047 [Colletotrichum lupini]